jgi:hypothetical protein
MKPQRVRSAWIGAAVLGISTLALAAQAEETNKAALAAAMKTVPTTLEQGLRTSEKEGKPISAKFEIEEAKLQLSIYTGVYEGYEEVIVAPDNASVRSSERITDAEDLKTASAQANAMKAAKVSLLSATEQAVRENAGYRAVSIMPELKDGHPVADVTLLRDDQFKTVAEKLD